MIAQNRLIDLDGILGHAVQTVPIQLIAFYNGLQKGPNAFTKNDALTLTNTFLQSILSVPADEKTN